MRHKTESATEPPSNYSLSTKEFAKRHLVEPATVRKQHSITGSYFGIRPFKLANRLLLWPGESAVKK